MNKYERLKLSLQETKTGTMRCYGNSMLPVLANGCTNDYLKEDVYSIGDIVFCRVKGRYIDAHWITKIDPDGRYMIANNHNFENGWTKQVFGRVIKSTNKDGTYKEF